VIGQSDHRVATSEQLAAAHLTGSEQRDARAWPGLGQASQDPLPDIASGTGSEPGTSTGRTLAQVLIVLVVLLALVNIPLGTYGAGLAQLKPDTAPVVFYDGMLLKGGGSESYLLEGHKLRPIVGLEAFDFYFQWRDVQIVEDSQLDQFGMGRPIRRLVRCQASPEIYALENGQKRRVEGPPAQSGVQAWDEVRLYACDALRALPEGPPILEDAEASP
jgi:hypothetical protein